MNNNNKNNIENLNLQTSNLTHLNPWFITGFADAEASFSIPFQRVQNNKIGFQIHATFQIGLHKGDRALLEMIRAYFGGVGSITKQGNDLIRLRVSSTKDLKVIIDHFNKYPLITQKRADFELFKMIVDIISRKEHLTTEGLRKVVNLRASINNGLSDELKAAFPDTIPVQRPLVTDHKIQDPN